eukprot:7379107-Prymnesium_polylepis.3
MVYKIATGLPSGWGCGYPSITQHRGRAHAHVYLELEELLDDAPPAPLDRGEQRVKPPLGVRLVVVGWQHEVPKARVRSILEGHEVSEQTRNWPVRRAIEVCDMRAFRLCR